MDSLQRYIVVCLMMTAHVIMRASNISCEIVSAIRGSDVYEIVSLVDSAVDRGLSMNAQNLQGIVPLAEAVFMEDTNIIKFLLDKGASINAESFSNGCSALCIAVYKKDRKTVQLLLERGASFDCTYLLQQGKSLEDITSNAKIKNLIRHERDNREMFRNLVTASFHQKGTLW